MVVGCGCRGLPEDLGCKLTSLFPQLREELVLAMDDLVAEESRLILVQLDQEAEAGAYPLADLLGVARQIAGNQP